MNPSTPIQDQPIAFIGGGNMASAIIGGLLRRGMPAALLQVAEPLAGQRSRLENDFGVRAHEQTGPWLGTAALVVWAVKPQTFRDAALQAGPHTGNALHLSVAAGIRSDSIARWLDSERVVRAMPNTPALISQGITALFARDTVTAADRQLVDSVVSTTGEQLWLTDESQLDAVTALSGSGPAYVFYFIEAMVQAGVEMGLESGQAQKLAMSTFAGSVALARQSGEAPEVLRERVTSKGGTTHAAITSMEQDQLKTLFVKAMHAARQRARELGDEFGNG